LSCIRKLTFYHSNKATRAVRETVSGLQTRSLVDLSERRKEFELKYADKLRERAKREGLSDFKELTAKPPTPPSLLSKDNLQATKMTRMSSKKATHITMRKDSSPVMPLTDIMDLRKIFTSQHSAENLSQIWNAYHVAKPKGTGRGYLSATIPLEIYANMAIQTAAKYPSFILPLSRTSSENVEEKAYEFFYLQWAFHEVPQHPLLTASLSSLPFEDKLPPPPPTAKANPICSTVLFTPLQEYKLRQSFAQPYLVLTFYTDLVTTHGIVLMRGELTPSPSFPEMFLLSQIDAQLLVGGLQRFYLADEDQSSAGRAKLLRNFHERADGFRWEDLLEYIDPTV